MELFNTALLPKQQLPPRSTRGGGQGGGFKSPIPGEDYFGIPKSPEGLQYTGDLAKASSDLFKKRQDLVNFAKTQWTKNKIDVTNPDPSRPEAVMAAEVFKMETGNYLSQVDRAKTGQELYKQMLPRYMDNTFSPGEMVNQQYASELTPEQMGYSMNVDPVLKFAQDNINRSVETGADYNARMGMAQNMQGVYQN